MARSDGKDKTEKPKAAKSAKEVKAAVVPPEEVEETPESSPHVGTKPKEDEEQTPPAPAKETEKPKANGKAKPLRDAYESLKTKYAAMEKELKEHKSKAPTDLPEVKTMAEKLKAAESRLQEYDSEMLYVNAEKSEQFQKEHYQPYVTAYQDAYSTLSDWPVAVEGSAPRAITPQEFQKIVQAGSGKEALEVARSIYGDEIEAGVVFAARQSVVDAARRLQRAKENIRQTAEQRQQQTLEQSRAETEMWQRFNQEAVEKYPQWFKPPEDDEKAAELLNKGYEFADKAFSPEAQKWTPEQRARHLSALRNRAAAFDRLAYENKSRADRIKELETELEEFKDSEPSGGEVPAGDKQAEPSTLDLLKKYANR